MKFKGRLVDHVILANGEQRLTIQTRDDLRGLYDQLHNDEVSTDVKKYRKPRSLDANAYFHLLVNRIAATVGTSDDEVKRELVVRYGTVEKDEDGSPCGIMLPATADVDRVYPYTYFYKAMELNGKSYRCYLLYKHTRDMDSAEMSHLIDGTVSEAKALGIETMTPDQIRELEGLTPP
jgi:hypothetical protein